MNVMSVGLLGEIMAVQMMRFTNLKNESISVLITGLLNNLFN